jgi:CheY-like chemotaxis protein
MPGWEVLRELQQHETTRNIPVVIVSADATSRQIKRLLGAGARAYLTKPIDVAEFFRVIEGDGFRDRNREGAATVTTNGNGSQS